MNLRKLYFMRMVIGAPFSILVGVYYFFSGIGEWKTDLALKKHGEVVKGRIVEINKFDEVRRNTKLYDADVAFKTLEGNFVHAYPEVEKKILDAHRPPNNYIDILYLPEQPEIIHIDGERWKGDGVSSLIGLASIGLGLLLGWIGLRGVEDSV